MNQNLSTPVIDFHPYDLEYLSSSQLRDLGQDLAGMTRIDGDIFTGTDLRARQVQNKREIEVIYRDLLKAAEQREILTPAAEWLLDNYFLREETMQQVQRDLPKRFYRQLPMIVTKTGAKVPGMTALGCLYLRHSHCEVTATRLSAMIDGYQQRLPCRIGELWAVPSLLRFFSLQAWT